MIDSFQLPRRFSRRKALQIAGAAGVAAATAGCVDTSDAPSARSGPSAGVFTIPDWAEAPKEDVQLRWVDSGDQKALYWEAFFAAYTKKFPNIKVDYQGTNWNTIQESITLGLRNKTAPDVFQLPSTITPAVAVREGYLQAYDDVMPELDAIKAKMPTGMIAAGVTEFDGKIYPIPATRQSFSVLLLINNDLAAKSDIDPDQDFTMDTFGAAVRAATKTGNGDYYGLIEHLAQPNGMNNPVNWIAQLSGMAGGADNDILSSIDFRTGEFNYTDPLLAEVVDWYLGLAKDGVFVPGSVSLDAPGARERFPQGQSVFIFQGPWNIGLWGISNPDLKLGATRVPVQDNANTGFLTRGPGGGNGYCIAANSEHADVVGNVFSYLFSDQGQRQWDYYCGSGDPAAFGETGAAKNPLHKKIYGYDESYARIGPSPTVRNPDVVKATQILVQPTPNLHDVYTALFTGETDDIKGELQSLQDRSNKALDKAIATAKKEGANVSRDDFVFSDWVYGEPYEAIYK
jgi:multiple sugar transport system substrate-binding protein